MVSDSTRVDALRATGWIVGVVAGLSGLLGPVLAGGPDPTSLVGVVSGSGACVLAAFILDRQPANRAAWGFLAGGVLLVLFSLLYSVAAGRVRAGDLSSWVGTVAAGAEVAGVLAGGSLPLFQFLFPDGRLPSSRWRPVFAAYVVGWLGSAVVLAVAIWPLRRPEIVAYNGPVEVGIPVELNPVLQIIAVAEALAAVGMLAGVGAIASRLRGTRGADRRRILLALWGLGATAALIVATSLLSGTPFDMVTSLCAPLPVLVALTIAMRRHQLFGTERLVEQTLTYGSVTALVVGIYAVVTIVLGALVARFGVEPSVTVAAGTLAAAAAFRPLLHRVRARVDRHFDRRTWLAVRAVEDYTEAVRTGRAAPADLESTLRGALDDPAAVIAFVDGGTTVDVGGRPRELGEPAAGRTRRMITAAGSAIAEVDLDGRLDDEPRLLDAVLAAAALPVEHAAMQAHAAVHIAEVQASRSRIVAAEDTNLRRIERDLHDGAQQRLVALALRLRIAQRELGAPDSPASAVLGDAVAELRATVTELRELTRGVLPPVLTDEGLAVALPTVAARLPVPVSLDVTAERFAPIIEATAWFVTCEAIANAAKHAVTTSMQVYVQRNGNELHLRVVDDGGGGAVIAPGGGLQGLADRVAAVGGRFRVISPAGGGTRIEAELPCTL